jgi:DNA polymerase I-like protein with 3'-5' exonuclease and polymerase domains
MITAVKLSPNFVGVVQITSIENKPGPYGECAYVDFTVIETSHPDQHWIGQPGIWIQNLTNEARARGNFREFLAALGIPESEMTATINAALASPKQNALTNRRVRVQTYEKKGEHGPYVVHNWMPYAPTNGATNGSGSNGAGSNGSDGAVDEIPPWENGFRPEHTAYLEQRAVPSEFATAAGLVSVGREQAAQLLALTAEQVPAGGLAIPYPRLEPPFWRIRLDAAEGGTKFLAPPGRGAPIYDAVAATKAEVEGPLVVCEGPVKSLALAAIRIRGLGLGGAETGLTKDHALDPSWSLVAIPPEGVVLLPDADVNSNYGVMRGMARLAKALVEAHPERPIKFARLPGPGKRGPDDFLAEQGADALRAILTAATPVKPSDVAGDLAELDKDARTRRIAELLEDKFFLVSVCVWGEAETFRVRELFRKGGAVTPLNAALKATAAALRQAHRGGPQGPSTGPYRTRDGKFWAERPDGELEQLTNFTGAITAEKMLDDGVAPQRILRIRLTRDNGDDLGEHDVPADEFGGSRAWVVRHFTASAVVLGAPSAMAHTRAAIQMFSGERERVDAYSHTGFRELVDATGQKKLVYLHAGGAVNGEGVIVSVDAALARFRLPDKTENAQDAVRLSLRMLDVAPDRISVPLLCTTYLGPLTHWISADFVKWVWGPTGYFKTAVETMGQAHYGDFDAAHLPGSWLSTSTSLEYLLSRAKDALTIVDDFVPKSAHDFDEVRRKGAQLVRSVGNHASRGRMKSDLTARPDRPPRGVCVVTGEDQLSGQSDNARTFSVRYSDQKLINRDVLTELQLHAKRLPHALRGYVEFSISQAAWLDANAKDRVVALRMSFVAEHAHARQPNACAQMMFAAETFAAYARSVGVFDAAQEQLFLARARLGLVEAATEHASRAEERKPVTRFLATLASLLAQRKVVLVDGADTVPQPLPGEIFVGWRDGDRMLLLPEPTYRAVVSEMGAARESFPIAQEALWSELLSAGLIAEHLPGRTRTRPRVGGKREYVISLWARAVEGPDEPDPGGTAQQSSADSTQSATPDPQSGLAGLARSRSNFASESDLTSSDATPLQGSGSLVSPEKSRDIAYGPLSSAGHAISLGECGPLHSGPARPARPDGELPCRQVELGRPREREISEAAAGPARPDFVFVADTSQLPALAALLDECAAKGVAVALDTETTGLDPLKDRVRLVQLGIPGGAIYVIGVWATGGLGPLAESLSRVAWIGHHLYFDLGFLRQLGVQPTRSVVDTMLLAQVLDCGLHLGTKGHFTLAAVLERQLGVVVDKTEQASDWSGPLTPEQLVYAARDVEHLDQLAASLATALGEKGLTATAALECDALPTVAELALAGVRFDRERWSALVERKRREAAETKAWVESALAIKNANSTKQLLPALQQRFGPAVLGTSAEALAPYASDPLVESITKFRAASMFASNHGEPILASMVEHCDDRVHAHWTQIGVTGRMSCGDPPLLNLPKTEEVRSCVTAAPGHVLIVADYSQIELRIAAQVVFEATRDTQLIQIYQTSPDLHRATAALIAGVPADQITGEQRSRAKPVNFGFLFGMGASRFVDYALTDYGVVFTLDEAKSFKQMYLRAYPGIARWQALMRKNMPTEVRTLGGRIRAFPDRREGYTHRLNHPVQGTALDGFKAAMAILSPQLAQIGARIVLAVHDEFVVEAPEQHSEAAKAMVEAGMIEGMSRFVTAVPVVVEARVARNWAEATEK